MKKFYSDYIRHCTKQYFNLASAPSAINDRVTYNNYVSVANVLERYDTQTTNLLRFVYTGESIQKAVDEYASRARCKSEQIWYIVQTYEKEVAIERGLL